MPKTATPKKLREPVNVSVILQQKDHDRVRIAAAKARLTVSEWIRKVVKEAL